MSGLQEKAPRSGSDHVSFTETHRAQSASNSFGREHRTRSPESGRLKSPIAFYCGVLGFDLMQRYGHDAAFLSAGGYHHHIALNTWESKGGSPPGPRTTGLYHFAIRYPTRAALADALRRLIDAGISLEGASDHGVSEALYLSDPDKNGIELSWDRPKAEWPLTKDGHLRMDTRPLDTQELLREPTS